MWKMTLCPDSFSDLPTIEMDFDSPEGWRAWLREHHPALLEKRRWSMDGPDHKQHGTDSYWSSLQRVT